jgi:hypothetical protein
VLLVSQTLSPLASITTATRIITSDVNETTFAFLCHGRQQAQFLELHVHPIPGCSSPIHEAGIVLHLTGYGRDVSKFASDVIPS